MNVQIFAYKGWVGIKSTKDTPFVNDPNASGQLGCIVLLEHVDISSEAYNVLKNVKKSNDAIGDVMCGGNTFSWLGGYQKALHPNAEADRDYEPSLLYDRVVDGIEIPQDFKDAIDKELERSLNKLKKV